MKYSGASKCSTERFNGKLQERTTRDGQKLNAVKKNFVRRHCKVSELWHIQDYQIRERIGNHETTFDEIEKKRFV